MDKKIYRVKSDRVISANIIRETKRYYFIDDIHYREFGYKTRFDKEYVCLSPREAVQEELNTALTQFGIYKERFEEATKRLEVAKKLKDAVIGD